MTTHEDHVTAVGTGGPEPRRWLALSVLLLAVFMDLIDITIVVIAVPSMQSDLDAAYSSIQWVMAAYALAFGLLLITGGRLGDILGRKRMFLVGVALFTFASAASAVAPTTATLIAARIVQGAAAGMMVPQVLAVIQVSFPPAERPKAYGFYGAVNGLAAASAPIVGGLLVGHDVFGLGWRSVFWINVPIGLVALMGGAVLLRESRATDRPRLDIPGMGILTVGLLLLLYPLIQGGERGWPAWGWVMMAAAVPVLAVFAAYQQYRARTGYPLVPNALFRNRSFATGLAATFVLFSSIASSFLALTLQLQSGHQLSALRVGLIFMAWPLGLAASAGFAVQIVQTMGRKLITLGALLLTIALVILIATIQVSSDESLRTWALVPGLLLGGVGFGLVAPVLVDIVLSAVPHRDAGAASGVVNTTIQVANAAGIAVAGTVFASSLRRGQDFDAAAVAALWVGVAAYALGLLLSFTLPRSTTTEQIPAQETV